MTSRSTRTPPTGRVSMLRRGAVVAASLALVLAACGDDDADGEAAGISVEDGTTDEDATEPDDDATEPDDTDPDQDADPDADPDADTDEDTDAEAATEGDGENAADTTDDADDEAAASGPNEHRPSADGQPDCDAVTASPPGAVISFPSDDDPGSLDAGPGPVTVEIVGCSDSFEANIQYDAFHGQDRDPTISGFTEGGTMGNWGAFSIEETYYTPGEWTVVVFVDDAESGDRMEFDEVTFTVG